MKSLALQINGFGLPDREPKFRNPYGAYDVELALFDNPGLGDKRELIVVDNSGPRRMIECEPLVQSVIRALWARIEELEAD